MTINRHSGAVAAHDGKAQIIQAEAEARFLRQQVAAARARQKAARALGQWLIRHGLNTRISAKALAQARARAISLRGVSARTIAGLEHLGVIASRQQLSQLIANAMGHAPAHGMTMAHLLSS